MDGFDRTGDIRVKFANKNPGRGLKPPVVVADQPRVFPPRDSKPPWGFEN